MIHLNEAQMLIVDSTCVLTTVRNQVRWLRKWLSAHLTLVRLFTCERNKSSIKNPALKSFPNPLLDIIPRQTCNSLKIHIRPDWRRDKHLSEFNYDKLNSLSFFFSQFVSACKETTQNSNYGLNQKGSADHCTSERETCVIVERNHAI